MTINKQSFAMVGVTEKDYFEWCKQNNKPDYKPETKSEFFSKIAEGRLVKDSLTGKLVKKNKKK